VNKNNADDEAEASTEDEDEAKAGESGATVSLLQDSEHLLDMLTTHYRKLLPPTRLRMLSRRRNPLRTPRSLPTLPTRLSSLIRRTSPTRRSLLRPCKTFYDAQKRFIY
jgi:hypothetical protein